ncbi:hypothetical protein LTR05_007029 [Lithohypha guttulata]|uniref:Uncharacterized protein n=1 Tax=Lithohypha guttulata TaxID=1690604 RepID=A0AAN7SW65_9EURO|nr:hypothetical protein LTR05_007029 [Lithohypha guttulata]
MKKPGKRQSPVRQSLRLQQKAKKSEADAKSIEQFSTGTSAMDQHQRLIEPEDAGVVDVPDTTQNSSSPLCLMDLPVEVRMIILRYLLKGSFEDCHNGLLFELPTCLLNSPGQLRILEYFDYEGYLHWPSTSTRQFSLTPSVLRTCKQLEQEGLDVLYKENAVGITFLYQFVDEERPDVGFYSRPYCFGEQTLEKVFQRYPKLRKIEKWHCRIYVGPATQPAERSLVRSIRYIVRELRRLPTLEELQVSWVNAAVAATKTDYARPHAAERVIAFFHSVPCKTFKVETDHPLRDGFVEEVHRYQTQIINRTYEDLTGSFLTICCCYEFLFKRCRLCFHDQPGTNSGVPRRDSTYLFRSVSDPYSPRLQSSPIAHPFIWRTSASPALHMHRELTRFRRKVEIDKCYVKLKEMYGITIKEVKVVAVPCEHIRDGSMGTSEWLQHNQQLLERFNDELEGALKNFPHVEQEKESPVPAKSHLSSQS